MPQYSDPGIPTLTQRAEPTLAPADPSATPAQPPAARHRHDDVPVLSDADEWPSRSTSSHATPSDLHDTDPLPVLTEVIDDDAAVPPTPVAAKRADQPQAAFSTTSGHAQASTAVLRAALQAELEQALQLALDDATDSLRTRLEDELPALITRALDKVRPG